jgi:hypothetical protein
LLALEIEKKPLMVSLKVRFIAVFIWGEIYIIILKIKTAHAYLMASVIYNATIVNNVIHQQSVWIKHFNR